MPQCLEPTLDIDQSCW